jgi:hypothetical protein
VRGWSGSRCHPLTRQECAFRFFSVRSCVETSPRRPGNVQPTSRYDTPTYRDSGRGSQVVVDARRDDWVRAAFHESVSFEFAKGFCEHFLTDTTDPLAEAGEAYHAQSLRAILRQQGYAFPTARISSRNFEIARHRASIHHECNIPKGGNNRNSTSSTVTE